MRSLRRGQGPSLGSRLSSDDDVVVTPSTWTDRFKGLAWAVVAGFMVFSATVAWQTLTNTQTIVAGHNSELSDLQSDVRVVEGYGAGIEWQLGRVCTHDGIDCRVPVQQHPHKHSG